MKTKKLDLNNFHICFTCNILSKNKADFTFKDLHLFKEDDAVYVRAIINCEEILFFSIDKFTVHMNKYNQCVIRKRKQKKGAQK